MSRSSESDSDSSYYEDLHPYFSETQWHELSKYEKQSYRSTTENYRAMLATGECQIRESHCN